MLKNIKRIFAFFERLANARGYSITWLPPLLLANSAARLSFDLEFVIAHLMLNKQRLFFIQIGANDGLSNDPIFKFVTQYEWPGILVEPQPEVFETLKTNYGNRPNLKFLNVALSEEDGYRTLYKVRMEQDTFDKAHEFSSFRRDVVARQTQWVPDIAQRIEETQVRCMSFDSLLQEAGNQDVDLLQIDTEGYDLVILKMIDFTNFRPAIICFEHCNLSKSEQEAAAELLVRNGYRLTRDNLDTIAYRPLASFGWRQ